MTKLQRALYRTGAIGAIVTAAFHMVGHLQGAAPAANDTEKTLWSLLTSYEFDMLGTKRTMWTLFQGFSLTFCALLAFVGTLDLAILRARREDDALLRLVAGINAAGFGVMLAISATYFILPPTICLAIVSIAFVLALLGRRPATLTRT